MVGNPYFSDIVQRSEPQNFSHQAGAYLPLLLEELFGYVVAVQRHAGDVQRGFVVLFRHQNNEGFGCLCDNLLQQILVVDILSQRIDQLQGVIDVMFAVGVALQRVDEHEADCLAVYNDGGGYARFQTLFEYQFGCLGLMHGIVVGLQVVDDAGVGGFGDFIETGAGNRLHKAGFQVEHIQIGHCRFSGYIAIRADECQRQTVAGNVLIDQFFELRQKLFQRGRHIHLGQTPVGA